MIAEANYQKRGEAAAYDFCTCQKFWLNFKININSADKKAGITCEVKLLDYSSRFADCCVVAKLFSWRF